MVLRYYGVALSQAIIMPHCLGAVRLVASFWLLPGDNGASEIEAFYAFIDGRKSAGTRARKLTRTNM